MAGHGTGYPLSFICPIARQNRALWNGPDRGRLPDGHDRIVRTGRTRPVPHGKTHSRKLSTSHEYRCECGHVGWSSHADVIHYPVADP